MLTSGGNGLPSVMKLKMMHRFGTGRIVRHRNGTETIMATSRTISSSGLTGSCISEDRAGKTRLETAGCGSTTGRKHHAFRVPHRKNLPSLRPASSRSEASGWGGVGASSMRGRSHRMMTTGSSGDRDANTKEAKMRLTTLRLYRMLQRSCKDLVPAEDGTILLQNDIQASDWGKYQFHDNGENSDNNNNNNNNNNDDDDDEADSCTMENQTNELIRLFLLWNGADPSAGFSKLNDWYDELTNGARFHDDAKNVDAGGACWTTPHHLRETVRFAFRSSSSSSLLHNHTATELQGLAVRAIQMMRDQDTLWKQSSVCTTPDGLVRVTATSRCLGTVSPVSFATPSTPLEPKHRFAYRIRVENVSKDTTVQLLGRYWHIAEEEENNNNTTNNNNNTDDDGSPTSTALEPIEVDAPYTGAVGQLPVLQPGQVFEYVSGTDLATPVGTMKGHFYMATVPSKTRSAQSGDDVVAVSYQGSKSEEVGSNKDTRLFQATVKPFRLQSFEK